MYQCTFYQLCRFSKYVMHSVRLHFKQTGSEQNTPRNALMKFNLIWTNSNEANFLVHSDDRPTYRRHNCLNKNWNIKHFEHKFLCKKEAQSLDGSKNAVKSLLSVRSVWRPLPKLPQAFNGTTTKYRSLWNRSPNTSSSIKPMNEINGLIE